MYFWSLGSFELRNTPYLKDQDPLSMDMDNLKSICLCGELCSQPFSHLGNTH